MIKFGNEYFIWSKNYSTNEENLMVATLHSCDHCQHPVTVNGVWVMNEGNTPKFAMDRMKLQADQLKIKFGLIEEAQGDCEGNVFCENCYPEHATMD
jgi:hypothetical protein